MAQLVTKIQQLASVLQSSGGREIDFDELYKQLGTSPPSALTSKKMIVGQSVIKKHLALMAKLKLVKQTTQGNIRLLEPGAKLIGSEKALHDVVFSACKDFLDHKGVSFKDVIGALDPQSSIESRTEESLLAVSKKGGNGPSGSDFKLIMKLLVETGNIDKKTVTYYEHQ